MAEQRVQRRLAAILAADVVGYSRLMDADEAGTLARLKSLRRELFEPKTREYGGRIFKTTGDGALVEFKSAVDAVSSAVDIQRSLAERNEGVAEDRRIALRIGVSLGDVIVEGSDLYGNGVNVAARMEGLAQPGGICISGNVHEHVRGARELAFDDLGEQQIKNIDRPVRALAVRQAARAAPRTGRDEGVPLPPPDKPSIAVLPFQNMSDDPEQDYFADGMVDEIITGLSRLGWLYVAARTSSFAFKGQSLDIREIARRLDVRYVLEGSVRKAGQRVRIIGQLIDAGTGAHIWADRFEGRLDDIFDLQDRITESVVTAIQPSVLSAEIERAKRKRPDSLDAYDLYLRALPLLYASSHEAVDEGRRLVEEALAIDPDYAPCSALASWFYTYPVVIGESASPEEDAARGASLAIKAINADAEDPMVLSHAPFVLATLGKDLDAARAISERGVRLYPKNAMVLGQCGYVLTLAGEQENALERFDAALRLNPREPSAYRYLTGAAIACTLLGRFADAVAYAEQSRQRNARFGVTFRILTAAYAQLGETDKAAHALVRYRALDPKSTITHLKSHLPYRYKQQAERLWEGLRMAGLPE